MSARSAPLIYVTVRDTSGNAERLTEQTQRIKKLEYTDSQKKADRCVLTVDNFDLSNFDDPVWAHGNLVQVSWGYPGQMSLSREVLITKVTGFTELKIEARGKSVVIDAVKRSRTFKGMTRSQVVAKIAREYGYAEDALVIEDTRAKFPHITQANITDAQLIRKLAHQQGFEFYVDHEGFHFHEMQLAQSPLRNFTYYTDPGRGDVLGLDVETDVTRRPAEVKKTARNPVTKETTVTKASNSEDAGREGTAEVLLIKSEDLRTGSLQSSYVPLEQGPLMCSPEGGPEAAKAETKAKFRAAQRAAVKITLDAVGDPQMLAKTIVTLAGVGKRLTGAYVVREVAHSVDPGKYSMKLKLVSDGTGPTEKRTQSRIENGLPSVAGEPSKAKRPPLATIDANAASLIAGQSVEPDALVAVPLLDSKGIQIGTTWRTRAPVRAPTEKAVRIVDGKAVKEGA